MKRMIAIIIAVCSFNLLMATPSIDQKLKMKANNSEFISGPAAFFVKNTVWFAKVQALEGAVCKFSFSDKELLVTNDATGEEIERLSFQQKGDQISFKKLSGSSSCSGAEVGVYKLKFTQAALTFGKNKDACYEREDIVLKLLLTKKKS